MNHNLPPPPPPSSSPFCQLCHGAWPDGHEDWCPIKTGEPVRGILAEQPLENQQQFAQNYLAGGTAMGQMANLGSEVEFVGGPLDGPNWVSYMSNCILTIQGDDTGEYFYWTDGRFHWIPK